jgi:hypothetical protein
MRFATLYATSDATLFSFFRSIYPILSHQTAPYARPFNYLLLSFEPIGIQLFLTHTLPIPVLSIASDYFEVFAERYSDGIARLQARSRTSSTASIESTDSDLQVDRDDGDVSHAHADAKTD